MGSPWRNFVFGRLRTDEGLEGIGEARPVNREEPVAAYLEAIAHRYVLGSDPFNIEDLLLRIIRDDYEVPGATEMTAIAIVEMACWDIIGKALGQPVYRLLGGAQRGAPGCDRGAAAHAGPVPGLVRAGRGADHPARHHPLRRTARNEEDRGDGRGLRVSHGASQRRRIGEHGGGAALRRLDAE